jgi:hypothetical protein
MSASNSARRNQALSKTERVRIERALYRLEIFRQAFEGLWAEDTIRTLFHRDWLDNAVPDFIQEFKQYFDTVELIVEHPVILHGLASCEIKLL